MFTMLPPPLSRIAGTAARVNRKAAPRSASMTSSQASSAIFHTTASRLMPALFTRMSSRPKRATVSMTARPAAPRSVPSAWSAIAQRPVASTARTVAAAPSPSDRKVNRISAPERARSRAIARPIPRDPPVTRATRPARSPASARRDKLIRHRRECAAADAAEREAIGQPLGPARRAGARIRSPERLTRAAVARPGANTDAVRATLLGERGHALVRLERREVQSKPVARVPDGHAPGEVLPKVRLLFRVAHALRERVEEPRREAHDRSVELGR